VNFKEQRLLVQRLLGYGSLENKVVNNYYLLGDRRRSLWASLCVASSGASLYMRPSFQQGSLRMELVACRDISSFEELSLAVACPPGMVPLPSLPDAKIGAGAAQLGDAALLMPAPREIDGVEWNQEQG
jgi:hypothetical protein